MYDTLQFHSFRSPDTTSSRCLDSGALPEVRVKTLRIYQQTPLCARSLSSKPQRSMPGEQTSGPVRELKWVEAEQGGNAVHGTKTPPVAETISNGVKRSRRASPETYVGPHCKPLERLAVGQRVHQHLVDHVVHDTLKERLCRKERM